jgi:hypothetical protein
MPCRLLCSYANAIRFMFVSIVKESAVTNKYYLFSVRRPAMEVRWSVGCYPDRQDFFSYIMSGSSPVLQCYRAIAVYCCQHNR